MSLSRSVLLAASQNRYLRNHATKYGFVRKSVSRFMPGETLSEALAAAQVLRGKNIETVLTHLGENIENAFEAQRVAAHYVDALQQIHAANLEVELSVKLTQLGLDLSEELCVENLRLILAVERPERTVWIDMEASGYVERTLEIYREILREYPNSGLCMQSYLQRSVADLEKLLPLRPSIRLVKGAYSEPPEVAFAEKRDVDENYFRMACTLLEAQRAGQCYRAAMATHDLGMIQRIAEYAAGAGIAKRQVEFHMLFGIQRAEQEQLAREGFRSVVLVAYGEHWYAWFVRRLAERPANVAFLIRNLF